MDGDDVCAICLDLVPEITEVFNKTKLSCRHEYHSFCLRKWFSISETCPLCKAIPVDWPFPDIPRPVAQDVVDSESEPEDEMEEEEEEVEDKDEDEPDDPEDETYEMSAEEEDEEEEEDTDDEDDAAEFTEDVRHQITADVAEYARRALGNDRTLGAVDGFFAGIPIGDVNASTIFKSLTNNSRVNSLNLERQELGNPSVQMLGTVLAINKGVRFLNLSFNPFVDEVGIKSLAQGLMSNGRLTHLMLRGCSVGDAGAKYLARALLRNKTLVHLDLRDSYLTNDGAFLLAQAFAGNETLQTLDVRDNPRISRRGVGQLQKVISDRAKVCTVQA